MAGALHKNILKIFKLNLVIDVVKVLCGGLKHLVLETAINYSTDKGFT